MIKKLPTPNPRFATVIDFAEENLQDLEDPMKKINASTVLETFKDAAPYIVDTISSCIEKLREITTSKEKRNSTKPERKALEHLKTFYEQQYEKGDYLEAIPSSIDEVKCIILYKRYKAHILDDIMSTSLDKTLKQLNAEVQKASGTKKNKKK